MEALKTMGAIAMAAACWQSANAHVVLEQKSAVAGSYYKATFMVGHGCDGRATTSVNVKLPPGIESARPQPKAGWTVAVRMEKLATPVVLHGKTYDERVAEITWTGGPLDAAHYDEFVVLAKLPKQTGPLAFGFTQYCGNDAKLEWTGPAGSSSPAPVLELTEPAASPTAKPGDAPHRHHH
ncbi:MAG TPA: YcnI family protein [Burkholderiaceae bacterium]|nr:YcnI family protein [Burkholderiaceae bacterium]